MSIKEIELAITQLTPEQLSQFTVWFEEFQAMAWDDQIEKDIEAGQLDKLIKEAEEDFKAGRCKPL
ncbi:MAG: hypothetical protein A2545_00270 [Planctomycetes bacterium RIFOXYD2_FULL_41_16]|nr:hypothetical protein [Planctomycetota bacterium]MBI4223266.1 hypothetical protein [Planctomycetota bacterium]OHC07951.1 MAG: hypothetical protein A2545_00270 [Planctomycetes bacterium RIFOXYD2_FULL_41_16]